MNINTRKSLQQIFHIYYYGNGYAKLNIMRYFGSLKFDNHSSKIKTSRINYRRDLHISRSRRNNIDALLKKVDFLIESKYASLCNEIPWLDSYIPTARLQLILDGQFELRTNDLSNDPCLDELTSTLSQTTLPQAMHLLEHLTLIGVHHTAVAYLLAKVSSSIPDMTLAQLSCFCNQFRMLPKGTRLLYIHAILVRFKQLLRPVANGDQLHYVTNLLRDISYFMSKSLLSRSFRHVVDFAKTDYGNTLRDPVSIVNMAYIGRRMFYSKAVDDELFEKLLRFA